MVRCSRLRSDGLATLHPRRDDSGGLGWTRVDSDRLGLGWLRETHRGTILSRQFTRRPESGFTRRFTRQFTRWRFTRYFTRTLYTEQLEGLGDKVEKALKAAGAATFNVRTQEAIQVLAVCLYNKEGPQGSRRR